MIRTVIRCQNDMVMVFDSNGEQVPAYQGQYEKVKRGILRDAPPSAVFAFLPDYVTKLKVVKRERW